MSGAIGYILPHGVLGFGQRTRIEFGGKYLSAKATNGASGSTGGVALQYLGGIIPDVVPGLALQSCSTCILTSTLSSEYSAWQLNAKVATDLRWTSLTLTPSLSLFGGNSRNSQSLSQSLFNYGYVAKSLVRWTDLGARAGIDTALDLTDWLSIGVGGTLGLAHRSLAMAADDAAVFPGGIGAYLRGSTVSATATRQSFVANAETSLAIRTQSNMTMKLFAGLNYDSDVPGISAPHFTDPFPIEKQQTPAGLKFESETSYYAGASLIVPFSR